MNIIVNGACGRMGKEVIRVLLEKYGTDVTIFPVDLFATNEDTYKSIKDCKERQTALLTFLTIPEQRISLSMQSTQKLL